MLLEQMHKTCSSAAAGGGDDSGSAAAADAAAVIADTVALVDDATIFINERKRDAGRSFFNIFFEMLKLVINNLFTR